MAARGVWLLVAAIPTTLLASMVMLEYPAPLTLPAWIEAVRPLLMIVAMWGSIMLWIAGLIMVTMPSDAKRAIALGRFAEARGMHFSRFGFSPPSSGIMFADAPKPLFQAQFALWDGGDALDPGIQIAVARYTGSKSDPKGPRNAFRYLSLRLSRKLPHLMIDSLRNGRLNRLLPGDERLSLEGDFDRHFAVYAPRGYGRDALELLTPDVMACLIDYGRHWDIEVVDERLIVASPKLRGASDKQEITALLHFAEVFGAELGQQVRHYSDPRATRPRSQVAVAGRRLRRRSAAWTTAIFIVITALMLIFPHILGWFLDRT